MSSFLTDPNAFAKLAEESGLLDRIQKFATQLAESKKVAGDDQFNAKTMTASQREAQMGANAGTRVKAQAAAERTDARAERNPSNYNLGGQGAGASQAAQQGVTPKDY
jgi:hypothetical protein